MRYLSSISLALIVLMALACSSEPAAKPTLAPTTAPPTAPAVAPVLTETLVAGLVESYEREGASHWRKGQNRTKENCKYASFKPAPPDGLCEYPNWRDLYPGWNCISSGRHEELVFRGSHWELMVSGSRCDGVEIFRIDDSYDGTVKRVRP